MKPRQLLLISYIATAIIASAQQPADSITMSATKCFVEAPMSVLPIIAKNTRMDMIDYFRAGSDRASNNEYGGQCRVMEETKQSVTVMGTDNAMYQVFLLNPTAPSPLIGIIETLPTPIPDSKITIYDSKWNVVPGAFDAPKLADWLTKEGKKKKDIVTDSMPFVMASYVYDPQTMTLVVTNNMSQYFVSDEGKEPLSLMHPAIKYKWNGKAFKIATK